MAQSGIKTVSQAAAIALRQLQEQLSAAYSDVAKLQQERAGLRADMHALADSQNKELQHSEAHAAKLNEQIKEMHDMLEEMKVALETTAEENANLLAQLQHSSQIYQKVEKDLVHTRWVKTATFGCACFTQPLYAHIGAESAHSTRLELSSLPSPCIQCAASIPVAAHHSQPYLTIHRSEAEAAQHQVRQISARLASAQLVAQDAEATSSQLTSAAASAEHRAQKLERKLGDVQWELEQCQQQLRSKTQHAEHKLKVRCCLWQSACNSTAMALGDHVRFSQAGWLNCHGSQARPSLSICVFSCT